MKVFITFEKDGYNGEQIDRVFLKRSDARLYVVTELLINKYPIRSELEAACDVYIEEHDVIETLLK